MVETAGWRAIFYLNLPVAVAAATVAWLFVDESGAQEQPLDWLGALLATVALGCLTWALTLWSSRHAASPEVWAGAACGAATLLLFVWTEHRRGDRAMMPLLLFASRPFVGLTLLTLMLYGALGGLLVLLPYLLIVGGGYSPTHAGRALLPFSVLIGTMSRLAGRLGERLGPRPLLTVGPIVTGAGFALLALAEPRASYWTSILPGIVVVAIGMAGAVAPLTAAVLSSVDDGHTGTASGLNSATARTGGLVATALAGAVMAASATELVGYFHVAALVGAALAVSAGVVARITLRR